MMSSCWVSSVWVVARVAVLSRPGSWSLSSASASCTSIYLDNSNIDLSVEVVAFLASCGAAGEARLLSASSCCSYVSCTSKSRSTSEFLESCLSKSEPPRAPLFKLFRPLFCAGSRSLESRSRSSSSPATFTGLLLVSVPWSSGLLLNIVPWSAWLSLVYLNESFSVGARLAWLTSVYLSA